MLLDKIERWYEVESHCADQLESRLVSLRRGVEARGGSIVTIHRGSSGARALKAKVLCEVPLAGTVQRL